ncbi:DUF4114 domain-containing protein [Dolichospermum lemmermannii CS-548]|uniref:DUF4114 domain-containing protein n=1 Tax=Dolichospermum lemmermannii TaxID=54295 RepID=UPI00232EF5CD|nr:DUF4114 domain-containing protein [Dolichospermum lemmermannii]MDB9438435.1 DUF4114 domain-containing protein [Dolichospermum lemmermannii CS-548]
MEPNINATTLADNTLIEDTTAIEDISSNVGITSEQDPTAIEDISSNVATTSEQDPIPLENTTSIVDTSEQDISSNVDIGSNIDNTSTTNPTPIETLFLTVIDPITGETSLIDPVTGEIIPTANNDGFVISGASDDQLGYSVSNAGDINGDGIGDVIIGSPLSDPNDKFNSGKTYVVFGSKENFQQVIDPSTLNATTGFVINGAGVGDQSGHSVSNIGDINGDGIDDLAIGTPFANNNSGAAYVVFGSKDPNYFSNPIELSNLEPSQGFTMKGNQSGDNVGWAVSSAGDFNGDGVKDLLIGATHPSDDGTANKGEAYIIFGKKDGDFASTVDILAIISDNPNNLGYSVSDAGDINGDKIDDIILGAPSANTNGDNSGSSFVIYGRKTDSTNPLTSNIINVSNLNSSDGFTINGQAGDQSGFSVSKAGDINGDGIGDLIIGAKDGNPNDKESAGRSYVVFGNKNGFGKTLDVANLNGNNGFTINGISSLDNSGWSVSGLGDINGDRIGDIIIGAKKATDNAGQSYVIYGSKQGFGATFELSTFDTPEYDGEKGFIIDGAENSNLGQSVSGAGDVNGDGVNDLIIGAPLANSQAGEAYVIFGTPAATSAGTPDVNPTSTGTGTVSDFLTLVSDNVFNIKGNNGKATLEVKLTGPNSGRNEIGVFTVDDASGKVDGIAPDEAGYAEKALAKGQVVFSTLTNLPAGFDPTSLDRLLRFNSNDNLRFYLVKDGSTDSVLSNNTSIGNVLFANPANLKITDLGSDQYSLDWEDGSGNPSGFEDFPLTIQASDRATALGTSLQNKPQGESLDLRGITGAVTASFTVNREASYNNFIGFYRVVDENGGIDTNGDGTADILPGQNGYVQAAINGRVSDISLAVNNGGTANFNNTLQGGSIYVPFLVVNGTPDALLDSNPNNNPDIYFTFLGANSDGVDHVRMLGDNTFGFEDLRGGGDKDFNDVIVKVNLAVA